MGDSRSPIEEIRAAIEKARAATPVIIVPEDFPAVDLTFPARIVRSPLVDQGQILVVDPTFLDPPLLR